MAYEGLAKMHPKAGGQWTGKVRLVEEQLDAPLRWSKPRRIFVNSMSDLFHEALSIEQIAEVFAVMYLAPRHTFQVLTKRAERMREVLTHPEFYRLMLNAADALRAVRPKLHEVGSVRHPVSTPAPWVHLGVSVESQKYANERIPQLLATPAALRFLSCEPLLESVSLNQWLLSEHGRRHIGAGPGIGWVIVGGESGPGARPLDFAWARLIVDRCKAAGVACFVKQLGAKPHGDWGAGEPPTHHLLDVTVQPPRETMELSRFKNGRWKLRSKKGGSMSEWPLDLRVREFPEVRRG
jgi:protein gp37